MTDNQPVTPRTKRLYCNACRQETRHADRGSYVKRRGDGSGWWDETTCTLWTCAGCDTGTLEVSYTEVGWTTPIAEDEEEQSYVYSYFPPRAAGDLAQKQFRRLPNPLRLIYGEAVKAYNQGLSVLCAAGLRALIEGICEDKKIKGKSLETKIDALDTILPKKIVENLHGFRFMGNEALHKLAVPKRQDLQLAIDVSEDLLNFLYELDYKASRLPKKPTAGQKPTPTEKPKA